jgi:hypothetical protein
MAIDPHNRPVREIPNDTTDEEMRAGHIIPGADPPKNEDARGGFGNREGAQGYGTDSAAGITAVSVNKDADKPGNPADNMRSDAEGRPVIGNEDMPTPDMLDPRRLPDPIDEIEGDSRRARLSGDDLTDPDLASVDSRNDAGEDEDPDTGSASSTDRDDTTGAAINYNSKASDARTDTNAELTDPNAQESGLDLGFD